MAGSGSEHLRTEGVHLSARGLVQTYRTSGAGRVQALSDVTLDIVRGETLGVVGESGSGKSTLARAILALPRPERAEIEIDGEPILLATKDRLRRIRHKMQMVFQNPLSSLNPHHQILDIVEMPLIVAKRGSRSERRKIVAETLLSVGLDPDHIGNRRPSDLSGGQCQRVSLARSLVLRPEILICDEPVSALDVSVQAQVLNLLEDSKLAYNLTMLFISHDLSVVRGISDRVVVMYLGKICEVGATDDLYCSPRHPYTAMLLDSIPTLDARKRSRAVSTGETPSPLDVPKGCRFHTRCSLASSTCEVHEPQISRVPGAVDQFVACHHPLPADRNPSLGHRPINRDVGSDSKHSQVSLSSAR
ncbi:oligopeptide/dipeptide ABC transporter ATP-binding protein [Bradyrhizobium sp. LTSPM299]|uniref:oligopeptide/dipeptide ABC transporter ATP-binding protein n=1 Tax=Bradyrhizobium sp. LTSPM299 TaxID=1619233 RepID=UPI0009E475C8|nr:oligopeptide/dipeptide ABC transporter ATP-binding protein [Bradyrhizobium sp. LTSPM299]